MGNTRSTVGAGRGAPWYALRPLFTAAAGLSTGARYRATWLALWALLVGVALLTRPLIPVDETRYLSVAWDMWIRGHFLVPHLNGSLYSQKPPLLFWCMQLGWSLFGVNQWWPRLVAPLFALASLFLTARLARRLWPERPEVADHAPLILLGTLLWAAFTTLAMFDMLVSTFALLAVLAVVDAWATGHRRSWVVFGAALGFGILAKGPVILVYTLPVALFAPWWAGTPARAGSGRWYGALAAAILLGAVIGLAWAVPAILAGGPAYAEAILWRQTADRVVSSFAHRRPGWWYVLALPPALLPWSAWPGLWQALRRPVRNALGVGRRGYEQSAANVPDAGIRLCLVWFVAAFVVFSCISGKQLHYMVPVLPPLALLAARALADAEVRGRSARPWLPASLISAVGVGLLLLPHLAGQLRWPAWTQAVPAAAGAGLIVLGVIVGVLRPRLLPGGVVLLTAASAGVFLVFHLGVVPVAARAWDITGTSHFIARAEAAGTPVGVLGDYEGEYQFLGRLQRPLPVVPYAGAMEWVREHPQALLVVRQRRCEVSGLPAPVYSQPFRGKYIDVWSSAVLAAHPAILRGTCGRSDPS